MNFLGLRSQASTAAQQQQQQQQQQPLPPPPPIPQPQQPILDNVATEDPFPLASLIHHDTFNGTTTTPSQPPVVVDDKHIDVSEHEGWITIPRKELPDTWNEEPDILSFKSFDRSFVFPGEQVHILACLSACKQDTEIITPFKVAEMMSKNAKNQNGQVTGGESLLRMEDYRRQTEMLLERFRNSHFFARTAEADEPLWSKRKTQETFRESTEMIGGKFTSYDVESRKGVDKSVLNASDDKGESADAGTSGGVARNGFKCSSLANGGADAGTSGGVARNGFKCSSLANGDIVVLLQVNIGVDCLKDPVLEIIQFEKYQERALTYGTAESLSYSNEDPCGDLLKWLLPLENSLPSPSRSLSPPQLSSSSTVRSTSSKINPSGSSSSPIFSFGNFRSYSMSSVPPNTIPPVSPSTTKSSIDLEDKDQFSSNKSGKDEKGEAEGLLSFRGVPLEPERFSVRCGLEGIYIPGRRWRRKVEIIQPVEISSFAADCNTEDLLCVQIKNVAPAHIPDIVIYLDTITIIHEEASKGGPPLSLPIACIEAGNDHSLPDLALRRGEEHSFILKPATSLWRNSKGQSDRSPRSSQSQAGNAVSSAHSPSDFGLADKYAVLVSCRCNYTESRLFFKQPTSWRPRMSRDLLISVASQMSKPTLGSDDRVAQLPVQVLTLEASNLTSEDLTLTVLAPASFTSLPSVVSLNSTPASPMSSIDVSSESSAGKQGIAFKRLSSASNIIENQRRSDDSVPQMGSFNEQTVSITDVLPRSDLGCTHLWLQSRVPLGCVPSQSTATIKLELLPLTDGIITLDSLQISVKEKGLTYVPEHSLKINATSSISTGII